MKKFRKALEAYLTASTAEEQSKAAQKLKTVTWMAQ